MRGDNQIDREDCYICGEEDDLERHHIVPRRYGGSDDPANLVDLCHSCHQALEHLYNRDFYRELGARGNNGPRPADGHISSTVSEDIVERLNTIESQVHLLKDDLEWGHYTYNYDHASEADSETDTSADEEWDVSAVETGASDEQRERTKIVIQIIRELGDNSEHGIPVEDVVEEGVQAGIDSSDVRDEIRKLREQGDVYEPESGCLRSLL